MLQMFMKTWGRMSPVDRFKWGQKGASLVHSGLMAAVGLSIVLQGSWNVPDLMTQKDDRVAAFIGLELGYLIQVLPQTILQCLFIIPLFSAEPCTCTHHFASFS